MVRAFPDTNFFGEENGGKTGLLAWIVDPIDGTANFLSGLPNWGKSIALVQDGEPLIGVIILSALKQECPAIKGKGSTCNGSTIRVSDPPEKAKSTVIFGRSTDLPRQTAIPAS